MKSMRQKSVHWWVGHLCVYFKYFTIALLVEECLYVIQEEEANARKAREEEAAALEFDKWKGEFSVDDEGTVENEVQDGNQDLLSDFVDYIKVWFSPKLK